MNPSLHRRPEDRIGVADQEELRDVRADEVARRRAAKEGVGRDQAGVLGARKSEKALRSATAVAACAFAA